MLRHSSACEAWCRNQRVRVSSSALPLAEFTSASVGRGKLRNREVGGVSPKPGSVRRQHGPPIINTDRQWALPQCSETRRASLHSVVRQVYCFTLVDLKEVKSRLLVSSRGFRAEHAAIHSLREVSGSRSRVTLCFYSIFNRFLCFKNVKAHYNNTSSMPNNIVQYR